MAGFVPVEDALFGDDHAQAVGRAIDHAGAHAAAGALSAGDDRIDAEKIEMADERRAPKRARRSFSEYGFAGDRFYLIDDVEAPAKTIEIFGAVRGAFFLPSRRKDQGSTATPSKPVM